MKIILGSPASVVPVFSKIIEDSIQHGHEVIAIVSQPAKEAGRGKILTDPPVAEFSKSLNIKTLQPIKASDPDFLNQLKNLKPDVMITAAYGQILTEEFLKIPTRGTINIHPSLLPKYRGAIPVPAALLNGEKETGVTILFTVKKLDAGNIITQKTFPILQTDKADNLLDRLFKQSGEMIFEALELLKDPAFNGIPQVESEVSHCKKISKEDGHINWNETSQSISNKFRGLYPCQVALRSGKRVSLDNIRPSDQTFNLTENGCFNFIKSEKSIAVRTSTGSILVSNLKNEGGKLLDATSFWNGLKNKENLRFE